ncbi:Serine/threonine protein kinase [Microcystis aeruginosa PCC 9809]|uniref:non-specific serine/threonine protein kinase n=1 Tax=Microcystis aeruginosa PCC 9809 TaxID=1160285 RepID=I4HRV1_MICAE|nr:serine/threonine-protein kinase [Microcystis aeruginosa]CCI24775.1 Serine/threonine protein kinase [Microcystis aeruginosa PCC 9809]
MSIQEQGYEVIKELGRNRQGGRITWLATNINTGQQQVIKQFCFAQAGANWSSFAAHEREIRVLTGLKHPGIPSYLGSFEISDGFCLVQEYINAPNLAETRSFAPEEIKKIAVKVLEILVYLQNRIPPIIHRDIKPENILVDEQINVYLIDFGFARIGSHDVAGSSVFKGTPGFIPPEQMFKPTDATDLYALGATLICLLTGIKSTKIDQLQDADYPYLINFRHLLPQLSLRFIGWLEKMVQPQQKERFSNAELALEALKPLDIIRVPGVDFSGTVLEFKANRLGEKLTQSITVENPIPDTFLEGRWEVAPHPHDPPHTPDNHAWISLTPAKFNRNNIRCQVEVDTSKLMADKRYKRQLILHSNAYPASHTLTVKVQTAPLPIDNKKLAYAGLIKLFLIAGLVAMATSWVITYAVTPVTIWLLQTLGYEGILSMLGVWGIVTLLVIILSWTKCLSEYYNLSDNVSSVVSYAISVSVGSAAVGLAVGVVVRDILELTVKYSGSDLVVPVVFYVSQTIIPLAVIGVVTCGVCWVLFWVVYWVVNFVAVDLAKHSVMGKLLLLVAGFGASTGIGIIVGFLNPLILLALTGTGLPTLAMLIHSPISHRQLIAKYRQSEESLIKP